MPKIKIDKFLEVLQQSNLLPADLLAKVARRVAESKTEVDPRSVAKWLVEKQYITLWQAKQLLAGRTTFYLGRYRLLDRIGKGGMGVVFKAQHAMMDRTVALKVMARHLLKKPRAVERFNREVKTAAALHHPNIITAFDADRVGNTHFLVMEYVEGVDLNSWLRARGPLPISAACECAKQAAEGLAHANAMGMVHRDIKPVNLLVTWDHPRSQPVVKLLDMGLARFVSETQEDGGLTRVGQTIGTPDYIAPEAAENFKNADIRADIFSLGCTLFRLLTTKLPYSGENTMEKLIARATRDAPAVSTLRPEVPPELDAVVAKMLARDPANRYQTPSDVVEALKPFAASTIGDTAALEFFQTPPGPKETLSTAALEADADTSLEDFFRDFSAAPQREETSTPDPTPASSVSEELGLAPDDSKELGAPPRDTATPSPSPPAVELEPVLDDSAVAVDQLDLAGDLLDDPLAAPTRGQPRSKGAFKRPKSPPRTAKLKTNQNVWDTKLLLVGGGTLLALILVGVALVWAISRETGDQALALAEEEYRAGSYTQAIHRYDLYLKNYPNHPQASLARVHRGLAQIRQVVEGGSDWPRALETAQEVVSDISSEAEFGEARGDLASLLPRIAIELSQQARQRKEPELVEQTREAVALVERFVPRTMLPEQQLLDIDARLALTQREMDRDAALAGAIEDIGAAVAAGDTAAAFDVRKRLLKTYPDLEGNDALHEAILSVTEAQRVAVQHSDERRDAQTTPPESPVVASLALAARSGSVAPGVDGRVVFALAEGAAYGLDAASGEVLWRRYVGFDTNFVPQAIGNEPGGDAVLVDSVRNEIWRVDARSGDLRWRQPIEEPMDAAPVLLRNRLLVATRPGRLVTLDLESGAVIATTQLSAELTASPAVDASERHIYQVADHSTLYVLDAEGGTCREVAYLGHESGNVRAAPLLVSRYVILADNHRFENSQLRVLLADEAGLQLRQVQTVPLDGHVHVSPLVQGRSLSVATDRGALYTFEIGAPDQGLPLTGVATSPVEDRPAVVRFPLVSDGQLFIADDRLRKYDVQAASGRLAPKWVNDQGDIFLQPLHAVGEVLFHVRRKANSPGAVVSAVRTDDGGRLWETELAASLVGAPLVSRDGSLLTAVNRLGGLYRIEASDWSPQGVDDQPAQRASLPIPLPAGSTLLALEEGWVAVGTGPGQDRTLLFKPADLSSRPRFLTFPDRLACAPLAFDGALLAPGRVGQVFLLDPASGENRVQPFQPPLESGVEMKWHGTMLTGGKEVLLTDGRRKLYRVGVVDQPEPHLAALNEIELQEPIVTPLAALENRAYGADGRGRLLSFELPSLDPAESVPLEGRVVWGPHRVGQVVLLATDSDRLECYDGAGQRSWQAALPHGRLTGSPLADSSSVLLSSAEGYVIRVGLADGTIAGEIDTLQPLESGPVAKGDELVVAGHDGTLLVIPKP